jgi:hypothetical protein
MTNSEKQSWEKVRARGRGRFLLRGVARGWCFFVGGVVVELLWWVFTKKVPDPLVATAAKWALVGVGTGATVAWLEWNENESAYHSSEHEGTR